MTAIDHDAQRMRFSSEADGYRGVLDYSLNGDVMTITHTGVPPEIGGRGIAGNLMAAALKLAHSSGWTVNPACSYAAAYMRKQAN